MVIWHTAHTTPVNITASDAAAVRCVQTVNALRRRLLMRLQPVAQLRWTCNGVRQAVAPSWGSETAVALPLHPQRRLVAQRQQRLQLCG